MTTTGLDGGALGPDDPINRPCHVCHTKPGEPCQGLDDNGEPTGERVRSFHAGRVFGPGPIVVRHTGRTNADGGGIFEQVELDSDEDSE